MQICVFLGSQLGQREQYRNDARKMGQYLASKDIGIVYGGASIGLMGELARAASEAGGKITGVIPERITSIEIPESSVSELIYVDTLEERENIMFDAFRCLYCATRWLRNIGGDVHRPGLEHAQVSQ